MTLFAPTVAGSLACNVPDRRPLFPDAACTNLFLPAVYSALDEPAGRFAQPPVFQLRPLVPPRLSRSTLGSGRSAGWLNETRIFVRVNNQT